MERRNRDRQTQKIQGDEITQKVNTFNQKTLINRSKLATPVFSSTNQKQNYSILKSPFGNTFVLKYINYFAPTLGLLTIHEIQINRNVNL